MKRNAGLASSLALGLSVLVNSAGMGVASEGNAPPPEPNSLSAVVLKSKLDKMRERTPETLLKDVKSKLWWACSGTKRGMLVSGVLKAANNVGKIKWEYADLAEDFLFGSELNDPYLATHLKYTLDALKTFQAEVWKDLKSNGQLGKEIQARIDIIQSGDPQKRVDSSLELVDRVCGNQPLLTGLVERAAKGIDFKRIAFEIEQARQNLGQKAPVVEPD